jgi:hypothetical protein
MYTLCIVWTWQITNNKGKNNNNLPSTPLHTSDVGRTGGATAVKLSRVVPVAVYTVLLACTSQVKEMPIFSPSQNNHSDSIIAKISTTVHAIEVANGAEVNQDRSRCCVSPHVDALGEFFSFQVVSGIQAQPTLGV